MDTFVSDLPVNIAGGLIAVKAVAPRVEQTRIGHDPLSRGALALHPSERAILLRAQLTAFRATENVSLLFQVLRCDYFVVQVATFVPRDLGRRLECGSR